MSVDRNLQIYLQRSSYRRRRMMDAVRLLPVLGILLWMLPALWPTSDPEASPIRISVAITYIFGVWAALSLAGLILWLLLRRAQNRTGAGEDEPDGEMQELS